MRRFNVVLVVPGVLVVGLLSGTARAASIPVPNHSFETPPVPTGTPAVPFTNPLTESWTSFDPTPLEIFPGVFVNADDGVFPNEPAGDPDSFTNHLGNQLAYIGSEGGNSVHQLLTDQYAVGQQYTLTAGVGRSFGSPPAATDALRLVLFYLDDVSARQEIGSVDVFNNAGNALSPTLLKDFGATTPTLTAGHPAIGRQIGILLTTTGSVGGFFDVDNVRLTAVPEPGSLLGISAAAGLLVARRRLPRA